MLSWIDDFLNTITMYRLVLYVLTFLLAAAVVFGAVGILPYSPLSLLFLIAALTAACWVTNEVFSWAFAAPTNVESVYITAFILTLIITPPQPGGLIIMLPFLVWVSVLAMASKYILAISKKHLFNPAAIAVAITAVTLGHSASWWVATSSMLPLVVISGLLITRKIQRFDLVISFSVAALVTIALTSPAYTTPLTSIQKALVEAPLLFLAFIMLTEPLTTPPTRGLRIAYGIAVGILFAPNIHIGSLYSTPELALLAGNIMSYFVSPKQKYMLRLKGKFKAAAGMYDFVFAADQNVRFFPGQYLEWTLAHANSDSRGNRRYFTIASSPTEPEVRLGVKFYEQPSSFKQQLLRMSPGDTIAAGLLSGDFTLPKNPRKKLAFIAGGIGITPFRSMLKYLIDRGERRPITLFYSNKTVSEILYRDIFDAAKQRLGIQTIYALTDKTQIPPGWQGQSGHITAGTIARALPDFKERTFYISGPQHMVNAFKKTLREMGVPRTQIKTDFFPGLA